MQFKSIKLIILFQIWNVDNMCHRSNQPDEFLSLKSGKQSGF